MGEELQTQIINAPAMDLDMGDDLQHVDPAATGDPEPSVMPGERVSGMECISVDPKLNLACVW